LRGGDERRSLERARPMRGRWGVAGMRSTLGMGFEGGRRLCCGGDTSTLREEADLKDSERSRVR
jgi:hypothetical protein